MRSPTRMGMHSTAAIRYMRMVWVSSAGMSATASRSTRSSPVRRQVANTARL